MPSRSADHPRQKLDRSKLDRDTVIDTALAVSDADGLDAVTIRRLAQELSVTPMAMYWHFEDKEALLAAVADRMWAETAEVLERSITGLPDDGDAWAQLHLIVEALIEVMRRHPAVAALVPTRVVECEPGLAVTERTLALLDEQGFEVAAAAEVARYVLCSAVTLVSQQPGAEVLPPEDRDAILRAKRMALAGLPVDRYPHVAAAAPFLTDCDAPEPYFARGVELVVAGVRDQAPSSAPPASPARRTRPRRSAAPAR